MMKVFSLIFIIYFPKIIFGQVLGTFCTQKSFIGQCITFKSNNEFEFNYWSCTGGAEGKGKYELTKDSLFLYFNGIDKKKDNHFEIVYAKESFIDSITIEVQIFMVPNTSLPYANLKIGLTQNPDSFNTLIGAQTDFDGKTILKLPKSDLEVWLICSYMGTIPTFMKLKLNADYQLNGYLNFDDGLIQGDIYRYEVITLKKNKIVLNSAIRYNELSSPKLTRMK